jgi:hypothetical protein
MLLASEITQRGVCRQGTSFLYSLPDLLDGSDSPANEMILKRAALGSNASLASEAVLAHYRLSHSLPFDHFAAI